ncbi:hypothetical protein [Bacillus mycoides]|uniref:hypothetical protein n=1 Tax=Bacillus mycoides TaxID=1405 RepID=UPI003CFE4B85
MVYDLSSLKDFIPFGSAILGAATGGFITYNLSKATQRRSVEQKRIESIFELKSQVFRFGKRSFDFKCQFEDYIKEEHYFDMEKIFGLKDELKNYFTAIMVGDWINYYSYAIHINSDVFKRTRDTHKQLLSILQPIDFEYGNTDMEDVKCFYTKIKSAIDEIYKIVIEFHAFLETMGELYVESYIEKYVGN